MGSYLEKNIQTFIEIQKRLQDQSRQLYGQNPDSELRDVGRIREDAGTAIQGLMGRYLEQSAHAFMEMQQQLQTQTRNLFGGFPFPGFPGTAKPEPAKVGKTSPRAERKEFPARSCPHPRQGGFVSLGCRRRSWIRSVSSRSCRAEGYLVAPTYSDAGPGGGEYLRLHRFRGRGVAGRNRRGAQGKWQGRGHRLSGRQG